MPRLVIANVDYLVTVDPQRRIIRDGALVIEGDLIAAVGKSADYPANPGDQVIDGRGKLALPGVFDTHVHNAQQLGRSCGDEAYSGPERLFPRPAGPDHHGAICRRASSSQPTKRIASLLDRLRGLGAERRSR